MNKSELFQDGLEKITGYKRNQKKLTGWFIFQELKMLERQKLEAQGLDPDLPEYQNHILCECIRKMPLSIPEGSVIAGTQDDAFSPSYALINPAFKTETFAGYCDPLAVYDDILPDEEFTQERIEKVRSYQASTPYVKNLQSIYKNTGEATREVAYFVEPVTGHTIPDMRPFLKEGIDKIISETQECSEYTRTMKKSLKAPLILAERYAELAGNLISERSADKEEVERLKLIILNCEKVLKQGAENLHEAVQSFALLWQVMCLEQAPNPYAFSVGNLDRILMPYLKDMLLDEAICLVRHLLAFFMVGDRCWAISQNVLVGGMDENGRDLTNEMSYIVLNAFYQSNNPQPALSTRLHKNSPEKLYRNIGRFFFTPGHSTPSLFNDNSMFELLKRKGIDPNDLEDYAIAGCQEPLIMGKENGNTTNSWLNLAKIFELTMNDGCSMLTGRKIGLSWQEMGYDGLEDAYKNLEPAFWKQFDFITQKMQEAANACTENLASQAVPFSSVLHGGLESGTDMRKAEKAGTKYHGSGCLIHGLSVLADSFLAVGKYLEHQVGSGMELRKALLDNYEGHEKIQTFLVGQDKYGNNIPRVDKNVARLAEMICEKISALKNTSGQNFMPGFSTPSTHLLYGYWVGATPDGRKARQILGYGIDPRPGVSRAGLQERILSNKRLVFNEMGGGYASHIGLSLEDFRDAETMDEKARTIKDRVIAPLFSFNSENSANAPYYVYFNIDDASHLRKVLAEPEKYAPTGIYIMRIHGTFVNFLDLSPAIQGDIIERLDPKSTSLKIGKPRHEQN
jgi:formate C-acetyltransferase